MYPKCCKKCGGTSLHTETKGGNTGLYCNDCGKWLCWLSKDDLRAFEYSQKKENKNENEVVDEKDMAIRLNEFVSYLDKEIEREYNKLPMSTHDAVRKNVYCSTLEKVKISICNILDGHGFNYT